MDYTTAGAGSGAPAVVGAAFLRAQAVHGPGAEGPPMGGMDGMDADWRGQASARNTGAGLVGRTGDGRDDGAGESVSVQRQSLLFCNGSRPRLDVWSYGISSPVVRGRRRIANRLLLCCSIPWKPMVGLPAACRQARLRFPPWGECGMWARPSLGQHATFIGKMLLLCPAAAHGAADGENPSGAVMSGSFGMEYRSTVSGRVQTVGNGPAGVRAGWRDVPSTGLVPTDRHLACIAVPLSVSCTAPYAGLFRGRF